MTAEQTFDDERMRYLEQLINAARREWAGQPDSVAKALVGVIVDTEVPKLINEVDTYRQLARQQLSLNESSWIKGQANEEQLKTAKELFQALLREGASITQFDSDQCFYCGSLHPQQTGHINGCSFVAAAKWLDDDAVAE